MAWTNADERTYLAERGALDKPPEPAYVAPEPNEDVVRASRYATIRKHLGEASKLGNLTNDTYLLAQIALVMCDVFDAVQDVQGEIRQLRVDMECGK